VADCIALALTADTQTVSSNPRIAFFMFIPLDALS
jgi:hypothetical protein